MHVKKRTKKQVVRTALRGAKAKALSQKALSAEALIEKGKERGYVTYSEILKSFPHVEDDVSFLESLYERFAIAGVDVLEGGMLRMLRTSISRRVTSKTVTRPATIPYRSTSAKLGNIRSSLPQKSANLRSALRRVMPRRAISSRGATFVSWFPLQRSMSVVRPTSHSLTSFKGESRSFPRRRQI